LSLSKDIISSMPTFDPACDGNVFTWIVATAARVREVRQAEADFVRFQQGLVKVANRDALLRAEKPAPRRRLVAAGEVG
jgi:hypothetical protein